jgi:hypothetical protein
MEHVGSLPFQKTPPLTSTPGPYAAFRNMLGVVDCMSLLIPALSIPDGRLLHPEPEEVSSQGASQHGIPNKTCNYRCQSKSLVTMARNPRFIFLMKRTYNQFHNTSMKVHLKSDNYTAFREAKVS